MRTICNNICNEIVIKNSRFITLLYRIDNKNIVSDILDECRSKYRDATHYCYAYVIDDIYKSSDDGEPVGTAGVPILQVLKKNDLNFVMAVVVRYFGGIKLGAGGLVRAYTKSICDCIEKSPLINLSLGYNLDIEFDYQNTKEIDYLLRDIKINNKSYNDKVIYNIDINLDMYNNLLTNRNINIIKKEDKYIEG